MKHKSIIFALALIVCACAEPEIKDPIVGSWRYRIGYPYQTAANPIEPPMLIATFDLTRSGAGYAVSNLKTEFNGSTIQSIATISSAEVGESIDKILIEGADFFIDLGHVDSFDEMRHTAHVRTVKMKRPGDANEYTIPDWFISR